MLCRKQIILIHDTGAFSLPQNHTLRFRTWYTIMQRYLIRAGVMVATVSEFSKCEIINRLHARPEQVHVIGNGADHLDRVVSDRSVLEANHLTAGRFVLVVGSLAPHKNLPALGDLATALASRGLPLVITGGFSSSVFSGAHLPHPAHHVGRVSDAQLKALYEAACCLVFPSRYEGFGLPAVEAMACGCPVVASGIAALREVCADGAIYAQPEAPSDITRQVLSVIDNPELANRLRHAGITRAENFTWKRAASRLDHMISHVGVQDLRVNQASS